MPAHLMWPQKLPDQHQQADHFAQRTLFRPQIHNSGMYGSCHVHPQEIRVIRHDHPP